jgi:hypothetical protein
MLGLLQVPLIATVQVPLLLPPLRPSQVHVPAEAL